MAEPPAVVIRSATEADLPRIVALIDGGRVPGSPSTERLDAPLPACYDAALRAIQAAVPPADVFVAEVGGEIVGTVSFAVIPNLSHGGRPVAQAESMHVAADWRGYGIGEQLLRHVIAEGVRHACFRLQLTSNKARTDAHRFYERLGFVKTHEGMKLPLA